MEIQLWDVLFIATLLFNQHILTLVRRVHCFNWLLWVESCFDILNVEVEVWLICFQFIFGRWIFLLLDSIQESSLVFFFLWKYRYPCFYHALRCYCVGRGRKKRIFLPTLCKRAPLGRHSVLSLESAWRRTLIYRHCQESWYRFSLHWLFQNCSCGNIPGKFFGHRWMALLLFIPENNSSDQDEHTF